MNSTKSALKARRSDHPRFALACKRPHVSLVDINTNRMRAASASATGAIAFFSQVMSIPFRMARLFVDGADGRGREAASRRGEVHAVHASDLRE